MHVCKYIYVILSLKQTSVDAAFIHSQTDVVSSFLLIITLIEISEEARYVLTLEEVADRRLLGSIIDDNEMRQRMQIMTFGACP